MFQNLSPFSKLFWYKWKMNSCICFTGQHSIYKKRSQNWYYYSTLHFRMLMILFNYWFKDSFLEVPILGGIFSIHPSKMWISKLSNAFIASLHINGLELYSTPNQVLPKCSSFSFRRYFQSVFAKIVVFLENKTEVFFALLPKNFCSGVLW